jgi:peptide/nickel transport system substrate-binding protein
VRTGPSTRLIAVAWAVAALGGCGGSSVTPVASAKTSDGGTIVTSIRGEPRSFNRYVTRDLTTEVITLLLHSPLLRVDRVSQQLEPELAERWTLLPDGVTYRIDLRSGIRFSDGAPFSSEDVVFSFEAAYDPQTRGPLADALQVRGQRLTVRAEGPSTVMVRFPSAFGPGLRLIAGVPIFPRHRLQAALAQGSFASTWGPATPPSSLAGLGPFVLRQYDPGQRLVFDRNPYDWRRDRGANRPAADHLVLEIIRDQDGERLAMETGRLDFTQSEIRPSDYVPLRRAADAGRVTLKDLGVGQDGDLLWFNLARSKADVHRPWLREADFRRAISLAVDREAFVRTVFFDAAVPAFGVVSPANRRWYRDPERTPHDPAAAARLLASLGLGDRNHDGMLEDRGHQPVRFSLLTQKGNTALERGAAAIRDSLQPLGIQVDVVPLEVGAVVGRFTHGDYDAVYFRLLTTDTDPSLNLDFWLSSGSAHVWNPSQPRPATAWEARIDELMQQMASEPDEERRRALFGDVQTIMARELPVLCFAFPRVWVAMSSRVAGATPAAVRPPILWNPAAIAIAPDAR